jgi:hypothetical protein
MGFQAKLTHVQFFCLLGGAKILKAGHHSLISDKAALLAFKKTITLDPLSTLANWDEAVDVCNFTRVTCNKQHHRVVQLRLNGTKLVGLLSPSISNLTGLRKLVLVDNHLFGRIPPEFSSLRHLRHLSAPGKQSTWLNTRLLSPSFQTYRITY